jgi:microcin C transport system permease protein
MIGVFEKYFVKNELTKKRLMRFKRNKIAVASFWLFLLMCFFSFSAEMWANSRPLIMSSRGKIFFPVFVDYHPTEFGREDIFVMDYKTMVFNKGDWAAWPLVQWDPYESNSKVDSYPSVPTRVNPFGTDDRGRDVFARILYGFRYSLAYSVGVWILSYIVGVSLGAIMGYMGGSIDLVGMRIVEIFESMPVTLLLLTMIAVFSPSMSLLILFSVIFGWTTIATYMRGEFLSLRKREFVEGAKALGASHLRIIFKHVFPNALTPVITFSPFVVAGGILTLANMDYLGLGLQPPTPSWGELLNQAQKYFTIAEWLVWWPSIFLVFTMILLINIGLAVRDAFDAKATI